jgi:hypothetical protein
LSGNFAETKLMKMIVSHRRILPLLILCLLLPESLLPQTPAPRSADFAFATQMGSGIYATHESVAQIYRVIASIGLRSSLKNHWGLLLKLPLTVGFYDYEIMDFFNSGLPQNIDTFALLPTLELQRYVTRRWLFAPFTGFGAGINRQQHSHEWITTLGLHNLFILPLRSWDVRLNSRMLYSESLTPAFHPANDFSMFESGIDFRRPLRLTLFGMELDGSIFAVNYIYKNSPHLLISSANPFQQSVEWEFGVTAGTVHSTLILGFQLPRVGLSYRFGSDRSSIRLIFGNVFYILSPRELSATNQQ